MSDGPLRDQRGAGTSPGRQVGAARTRSLGGAAARSVAPGAFLAHVIAAAAVEGIGALLPARSIVSRVACQTIELLRQLGVIPERDSTEEKALRTVSNLRTKVTGAIGS